MAAKTAAIIKKRMAALKELARVAEAMIDGEQAKIIISDRAFYYMLNSPPEHRYMSGDYFDVDHPKFLRMKKTLKRLEKLVDFTCGTSLWVRIKGSDKFVTVAVHNNRGWLHRYFRADEAKFTPPPEMKECFDKGHIVLAPIKTTLSGLTALAPVRDSLGDVVGVVELTTSHPAAKPLSPPWK
jgi:hypothetical protein